MNGKDPEKRPAAAAIVERVVSEEAVKDVLSEYAQLMVEAITTSDLLKHIPVVKTAMAAISVVHAVGDRIFGEKLANFLKGLDGLSQWERDDMVSRIEADPAYGRKVGRHVIELLDRVDSHRKPLMLAFVFASRAKGEIDTHMMNRLYAAIETLPVFSIDFVRVFHDVSKEERQKLDPELTHLMVNAGLALSASAWGAGSYMPNKTCDAFVALDLDLRTSPVPGS